MLTECIARTARVDVLFLLFLSTYLMYTYISFSRQIDLYNRWPPPAHPTALHFSPWLKKKKKNFHHHSSIFLLS